MNKSEIKITIDLDKEMMPQLIQWEAESPEGIQKRNSKAMLLSFFDEETLETFKIDLWTKKLQIAEMDRLMYNSLKALTETYFKATKNESLANQMHSFVHHFGKSTGIIKEETEG